MASSSPVRSAPLPPSPLVSPTTHTVAVPIQADRVKFLTTDVEAGGGARLTRISHKENKCFSCLTRWWRVIVTIITVLIIVAVVFRPAITNFAQNRYHDDDTTAAANSRPNVHGIYGVGSSVNRLPSRDH